MGQYSSEPDPPNSYQIVDTHDCVQYTNTSQAPWFCDRINFAYGGDTDARLEGGVVKWFGNYRLNVGDWLYNGTTPMSDEVLRGSQFRPVLDTIPEA